MSNKDFLFQRLSITGYRRLLSVAIDLHPLTVLIGANGIGKTSILEVFSIMAACAKGELSASISSFGGLTDILTRDKVSCLQFDISMENPGYGPLHYMIKLELSGQGYTIVSEELTEQRTGHDVPFKHIDRHHDRIYYSDAKQKKLIKPSWEIDLYEAFISQVPKGFKQFEVFRNRLASFTYYSAYTLNVAPKSPIRLPQSMYPASLPGRNGEELIPYLYYLRETDPTRFEVIEDSLSAAFPSFERLNFPPVAAGTLAMTWKDKNFPTPLYMHQLSEGTLRFLWLIALLQSKNLTAITLIDEPEVSLHPELLSILADTMREASRHTQLIVATHSDRLMRFLRPDEVLVMDADEEGYSKLTWAADMDIEHWLEDYTLNDLWSMGQIGGRA